MRIKFGILTKMKRFTKRSKNELNLQGKNRSKPIGKPTFGGSSWRLMLASSWLLNCHLARFCLLTISANIVHDLVQNCGTFIGFFNVFDIPNNSFSEVGSGFYEMGPDVQNPHLGITQNITKADVFGQIWRHVTVRGLLATSSCYLAPFWGKH